MRTTVILNDKLVAEAKRIAAEQNTTLSEILNEALRERLAHPPASKGTGTFRIPVFRGQGPQIDSTTAELARIGEDAELQPHQS